MAYSSKLPKKLFSLELDTSMYIPTRVRLSQKIGALNTFFFLSLAEKQVLAAAQDDPKSEVLGNKHTSFLLEEETSQLPKAREQTQDAQSSNPAGGTGSAPSAPVGIKPTFKDTVDVLSSLLKGCQ